jgi:hypothetical protein
VIDIGVGSGTGWGFTQSPPGVEMHMTLPMKFLILLQSMPKSGFHVATCAQVTLISSATLAHVSPCLTVRVLHFTIVGMQSVPEVGKSAQCA